MSGAWVTTGVTGALVRYDNLPVSNIVPLNGSLLALGPTGFFVMDGDTDDGTQVAASVVTGSLRLGTDFQKRLGNIYLAFEGDGPVEIDVEPLSPIPTVYTYSAVPPSNTDPRAARVPTGKGMWSNFYRFTIRNVSGAFFDLTSVAVDVAASSGRRI